MYWLILPHHEVHVECKKLGSHHSKCYVTTIRSDVLTPPPTRTSALELTCASPRSTILVRDRSHAHASRTRADTNRTHRQLVTARRYTGLTVTFSRPAESRLDTHTASEVEHTRSVLRSAVGRFSLDPAYHPCHAGAGAGCALSRPSWTASLAQRLRFCDN